jgi:hypothetical protein
MDIKGINNQYQYSKNIKQDKIEKSEVRSGKDKVEISDKAKILNNAQIEEAKKIEAIKEKIDSKFYDSKEVIEIAAENILKEIKAE